VGDAVERAAGGVLAGAAYIDRAVKRGVCGIDVGVAARQTPSQGSPWLQAQAAPAKSSVRRVVVGFKRTSLVEETDANALFLARQLGALKTARSET